MSGGYYRWIVEAEAKHRQVSKRPEWVDRFQNGTLLLPQQRNRQQSRAIIKGSSAKAAGKPARMRNRMLVTGRRGS